MTAKNLMTAKFQHTAARRRLEIDIRHFKLLNNCFNTQPPEGGWRKHKFTLTLFIVSTHSRPKAAGLPPCLENKFVRVSTHSRPKAAGASLKSLVPSGFAAQISLSSQEKR